MSPPDAEHSGTAAASRWRTRLLAGHSDNVLLGGLLLTLHGALWMGLDGSVARALLLAHFGLFLVWQPVWSRTQKLEWRVALAFVLGAFMLVAMLGWLPIVLWVTALIGLVAGRAAVRRDDRVAFALALGLLLADLLVEGVPMAARIEALPEATRQAYFLAALVGPALVALLPVAHAPRGGNIRIDFLYALTASLLAAVLAMGSLLTHFLASVDYSLAVIATMLGIGAFLLVLAWLWSPFAGFSGIGQVWTRHLHNVGTPFEHWVAALAECAEREAGPDEFLDAAMAHLVALDWVAGVHYQAGARSGQLGRPTRHTLHQSVERVEVTLYARRATGTALLLHSKLLLALVGHFHLAKVREQDLATQAHMRALYETGARMTHDVKNLLQSLHGLTAAIDHDATRTDSDSRRSDALQQLIRRQLPQITQRLQVALGKLQAPRTVRFEGVRLTQWWEGFASRAGTYGAQVSATIDADPVVPGDLFDSVVDNLLDNASAKRGTDKALRLSCEVNASAGRVELVVRDSGRALDEAVAARLFEAPVPSRTGLGVGLFQARRHAERLGYELKLARNVDGDVAFSLSRAHADTHAIGGGSVVEMYGRREA